MTREKILETALRQHKMKTQRTCCLDFSENLATVSIWVDENSLTDGCGKFLLSNFVANSNSITFEKNDNWITKQTQVLSCSDM